jgi:hypothetical protein
MADEREQRNQIFTSPPQQVQQVAQPAQQSKASSDFGLDIPTELVPLPSMGKTYPVNSSLHGVDSVEIRPMTTREEDILTSKVLLKKGTVLTELIKSCLVDKTISPADLIVGDRNALMVAIRITGYGHEYEGEVECPSCENKVTQTFDLSALPINRLDIDPVVPGTNVFETVFPYTKKRVRFKFLTGRDEEDIVATSEKQKKLGIQVDSAVTTSLLYSIVSIEGIEERAKIASYIKVMPARDSLALRNYISDHNPGIVMKQEITCPVCGHSHETGVPMGIKFLWPGSK